MARQQHVIPLALIGLAVVAVTVACANEKLHGSVPTAPREVIAALVKYAPKPTDPDNVSAVIVLDYEGNPQLIFPEGAKVSYPRLPIPATTIANLEAISILGYVVNPKCTLVKIAGGVYQICK
jgi:hypothetical protein